MNESPYRETPERQPDPYARAWSRVRWLKRSTWLFAATWVVIIVGRHVGPWNRHVGTLAIVGLATVGYAQSFVWKALKCPHCGGRFFAKRAKAWPWKVSRCAACNLAEGTPKRLAEQTAPRPGPQ